MSTLARKTSKLFGSAAADVGQFGSAQAGTDVISQDPSVIQGLAAWAGGWLSAVLGANKFPALEEMNGLQFVNSYQLTYLLQEGIPEYDAGTVYSENGICKAPGSFQIWGSLVANNQGNALTPGANWKILIDLGLAGGELFQGGTSTGAANAQVLASADGNFTNTVGNTVVWQAGYTNTGAMTLKVDAAAAASVKKRATSGLVDPAAGDIVVGEEYMTVFDGVYHQIMSPSSNAAAFLQSANNLSDLGNLATALSNLGFSWNFGTNGYIKFPSGFIINWGSGSLNSGGAVTCTYALAFPNGPLALAPTLNTSGRWNTATYQYVSTVGVTIYSGVSYSNGTATAAGTAVQYIAVGY